MKKNLLIVEDDSKIRKLLSLYFTDEGFNILEAETGRDAIMIFKNEKIDLVFLDIMLPEIDGLRVCEILREKSDVPVIMLTAKSQEEDKLRGFEYGADEYVTKPFSLKVLAARAYALMKRVDGTVSKSNNIEEYAGLKINLASGEVFINDISIVLTRKENDLLIFLIQNKGIILSKEQILDKVWGFDYDGDPRTVDTHIKRLRDKLLDQKNLIQNVRNRGYCFALKDQKSVNMEESDVSK
ncbi:MAG: response regulator transcription factor [Oscillospiraceae bacterium]|nr:response regulator transcription factor [Oscillospiraceae bacterium]